MLLTINEFVSKYGLENFVVVADSGLKNKTKILRAEYPTAFLIGF